MRLCRLIVFTLFSLVQFSLVQSEADAAVDVNEIASQIYGTELMLMQNQKSYRFEDFFWTGSGDGYSDEDENPWVESTTIYKTTTILSTVFIDPTTKNQDNTSQCTHNCEPPSTPMGEITPTPTNTETTTLEDEFLDADRQFWLLTVLKSDGKDPVIIDLKNSLAKLYKTAFQRQQYRHLGINGNKRLKREEFIYGHHRKPKKREVPIGKPVEKPVNVYIHKIDKSTLNGNEKIEVLYHVSVGGKPVAAYTAADDMTLVSDEEVQNELGYPFLIKAEPYLKASETQSLSKAKGTWMFIGVSIAALFIILLILAFVTLALTKRKRVPSPLPPSTIVPTGIENRQHIFERGAGFDNKGYVKEKGNSPTYIDFRDRGRSVSRPESSISSTSCSSTSLDISPLMAAKKQQRTPPKKPPRPKAAINKTAPLNLSRLPRELLDSDSNCSSGKDQPDNFYCNNDPGVVSPKSFLSMPSVKAFPKGNMPEPLNKVLEPVSVHNLDDSPRDIYLARHGSLGTNEDPGVIGPIVWNMHQQRVLQGGSDDDLKTTSNVSKMRKRFHDLLDDTFSLFGSTTAVNEPAKRNAPIEVKSRSAINRGATDLEQVVPKPKPRPKTTDLRRVPPQSPGSSEPKSAWRSTAPSPLVRPLSAGTVQPRINVNQVLAAGSFGANDPAIPLIAAIKTEIEKCSLPGSTTDLRQ